MSTDRHSGKERIFFDTEFSGFGSPKLISIGFVSSSDSDEFYAELTDTYQPHDCSEFVVEIVLPRLAGGEARMSEAQASFRLARWIESFPSEVVLVCDAPAWDWPLLTELLALAGWPRNLARRCDTPCTSPSYSRREAEYWVRHHEQRHNALVDARAMRFAENGPGHG